MVIGEIIELGVSILGQMDYTNTKLEARLILSKLLNVDKSYIYAYEDMEIDQSVKEEFIRIMEKRATGYPIQYILNEREFMGLDFHIDEGVLIPRPDTETLVEYVIDYIKENYRNEHIKLLDLGLGSGAIGLSIAHYCKNVTVYGTDISPKAIEVSNRNKERFKLKNITILEGDLFQPVEDMKNSFEIIVSNPPYIESQEIKGLQTEVKDYEPLQALDGGEDGLKYYREISIKAKEFLKNTGLLIYEIGHKQAKEVSHILDKEAYEDIEIIKDLNGKDRVVLGKRGG